MEVFAMGSTKNTFKNRFDGVSSIFVGRSLLLLATCLLAYHFYVGFFCSDDGRYLIGMAKIIGGEPIAIDSAAERRLFFLLPGALFMWLGGGLDWAIFPYLAFYLLMPQLSWSIAQRFVHRRHAAWAGWITAFIPLAYSNAGSILPDLMAGVFLGLALLMLVRAHQNQASDKARSTTYWQLFFAGASLALSVLVKESSLVLLPIPLVYFAFVGVQQNFRVCSLFIVAPFLLGLCVIFILDAISFRVFADTWHSSLLNAGTPHDFSQFIATQGLLPADRFAYLMNMLTGEAWFFLSAVLASLLVAMCVYEPRTGVRDNEGVLFVVAFFLFPFLYFTVGSASLSEYVPPVMQGRYYLPLLVPGSVLIVLAYMRAVDVLGGADAPLRVRQGAGLLAAAFLLFNLAAGMRTVLPERGIAHAAQAKESYLIARNDLATRFPGVSMVDTRTGWTSDLALCRAILRTAADSEDVAELRHATIDEPSLDAVGRPFIIVGNGNYLVQEGDSPLVKDVREGLADGRFLKEQVGDYFADSSDDDGGWFFPRQTAVRKGVLQSPEDFTISNSNGDPRAEALGLRAYLITEKMQ